MHMKTFCLRLKAKRYISGEKHKSYGPVHAGVVWEGKERVRGREGRRERTRFTSIHHKGATGTRAV